MTVHAAKGLEFPQVFIAGVEEGLFPHFSALKDERGPGVSEERRLMYVAITRAKQRLVITYCNSRMRTASGAGTNARASLTRSPSSSSTKRI